VEPLLGSPFLAPVPTTHVQRAEREDVAILASGRVLRSPSRAGHAVPARESPLLGQAERLVVEVA
jgi:hypothetical protein